MPAPPSPGARRAWFDPALTAHVVARRPLTYAGGADAREDRPAHVRAGSALAWHGARLCVVQDDAAFVAVLDGREGAVHAVPLARGPGAARQFDDRRGNKSQKLDLEACAALTVGARRTLVAFGSGSSPARETLVLVGEDGAARSLDGRALYAALRARVDFAGSELNVEGAVVHGDRLYLLNRGNGAPRGDLAPIDATVAFDLVSFEGWLAGGPLPALGAAIRYDLDAVAGCRLGFTDASSIGGAILYLAVAEASPDATSDGPVRGVALGVLGEAPRQAIVRREDGAPLLDKLEGLAPDPERPDRVLAIADRDDPTVPADLLTIELEGPWAAPPTAPA